MIYSHLSYSSFKNSKHSRVLHGKKHKELRTYFLLLAVQCTVHILYVQAMNHILTPLLTFVWEAEYDREIFGVMDGGSLTSGVGRALLVECGLASTCSKFCS